MAGNDDITARAETLVDSAEVLRAHGDLVDAGDALAEAVALHEEKRERPTRRALPPASGRNRSRTAGTKR